MPPKSGDLSVELQFNPFSNDFGTFKLDQLKGRYMFSDKDAIRFGIGFGVNSSKVTPDPEESKDEWEKSSLGNFSINLGWERHFLNYKRIDLYAGVGIGYKLQTAKSTEQTIDPDNTEIKSETVNYASIDNETYRTRHEFNINAFTGIDFYVYKGLYVGAEFGIRLGFYSEPGYYKKGGYNSNNNWSNEIKSDPVDKTSGIDLSCFAEPALRIGWTF